ncbi:sulfatase [Haloferula chungangensis]|uniref:Sulfatase n=1 Tax=Haloferula chungangensis TaxID=1048331 RepID=A0ABW2L0W2_9BACT
MNIKHSICLILLLVGSTTAQAGKPNIVFIIADDLGWADVGYNGAEFYETPNIDALCKSGMEFSMGYPGAANCLPSRSCMMSGMYTTRTKMWQPGMVAKGEPEWMRLLVPNRSNRKGDGTIASTTSLDPSVMSLAEMLKQVGYKTLHLGKWHLGRDGQGFDQNNTDGRGAGLEMDNRLYGDENVAEWITDAAVDYIAENKDNPFFLYLCHWDVHVPINARRNVVEKYQKKKDSKTWSQDWNPVYAAMVEAVDVSVGRIWQALKENGLAENTLLIFTSDNGGLGGATWNSPLKGSKGGFYEGGIRVPLVMNWPGSIRPGTVCDTPVSGVDYMPTFAELARASLPDAERQPQDGVSLVPLMKGKAIAQRAIYWHYPMYLSGSVEVKPVYGTDRMHWRATPCSIVRKGDWKLMQFFETGSVELYNLKEDIGEKNNLADQHPERASEMLKSLRKWQVETGADIPSTLNPDFDPKFKPNHKKRPE